MFEKLEKTGMKIGMVKVSETAGGIGAALGLSKRWDYVMPRTNLTRPSGCATTAKSCGRWRLNPLRIEFLSLMPYSSTFYGEGSDSKTFCGS